VWAEGDGRASVWAAASPQTGALVREQGAGSRPWLLLDFLDDLAQAPAPSGWRELEGAGARCDNLVSAEDLAHGSRRRCCRRRPGGWEAPVSHVRELGKEHVLALPPGGAVNLVATGRNYFRGPDLRSTCTACRSISRRPALDPAARDRIFMIAVRDPSGAAEVLEAEGDGGTRPRRRSSRGLRRQGCGRSIPDVIENHNLHGFDLPFPRSGAPGSSACRSGSGRIEALGLRQRAGPARGCRESARGEDRRRIRLVAPGRELIDTMDAVLRHGFATSELRGAWTQGGRPALRSCGA